MKLLQWIRQLLRPRGDETPPPLQPLNIPPSSQRRKTLDEAHLNIRHREALLRALEAKATLRGGGAHREAR